MDSSLLFVNGLLLGIGFRFRTEFVLTFIVCIFQDCLFRETTKHWQWQKGKERYNLSIVLLELLSLLVAFSFGSIVDKILDYHQTFPSLKLREGTESNVIIALETIILMVAMDAYFYFAHRFLHKKVLFKYIHKLHHRSKVLTPLSASNFSTLEISFMTLGTFIIISTYRFHYNSVGIFALIGHCTNLYYHFGVEYLPRKAYHYFPTKFLVSASYHEVHHTEAKYNFGLYFNYWDRIFGTIKPNFAEHYLANWEKRS